MLVKFALSLVMVGSLTSVSALAATGLIVQNYAGNQSVNHAIIDLIEYVGQCPGEKVKQPEAWFVSDATRSAPGRRVFIQNVSPGMDNNPFPFADRGYEENNRSEHTFLSPDFVHRMRTFSVAEGENNLIYAIKDGDVTVEQGIFNISVVINRQVVPRDPVCGWESRCGGPGTGCSVRYECRCPM